MKILWTPPFEHDFLALSEALKKRVEKTLRLLSENPRHPSLQAKKIKGAKEIWEARACISYRITYEVSGDTLILRRVGAHDILRKEAS